MYEVENDRVTGCVYVVENDRTNVCFKKDCKPILEAALEFKICPSEVLMGISLYPTHVDPRACFVVPKIWKTTLVRRHI